MTLRSRILILPALLLLVTTQAAVAIAQPATPESDLTVQRHLDWVLGLFEDGAADLTEAEVEEHFDRSFLDVVPADELVATLQPHTVQLGALEQIDDQSRSPGEFIGVFQSESGDRVMIAIAIDPESGLMSAFFITPAGAEAIGTPAASPDRASVASPVASPVAGPVVDDPEEQMALYVERVAGIRAVSEPTIDAVLAEDEEALLAYVAPELTDMLEATPISDVIGAYTTNQVQMVFDEAGAYFFGRWNDTVISGFLVQGGVPSPFTIEAEEPQTGDLPSGRFTGTIAQAQLEFSVEFSTATDGSLAATLDIPTQGIEGQELSEVQYLPERPVGEMVDESVLPHGGVNNLHRVDLDWGDYLLRVSVWVDVETQQVVSLQILPAIPTPPAAPAAPEAKATYQLPFKGLWWVYWGGDTELHNYHAATPSQRYAYDVAIWKDGATFRGDGSSNEDYWAWGQPVYAPASGTVIDVVNDMPDVEPNLPPNQRSVSGNPAGNHVVVETAESEYLFVAHMQQGSVQVEVGDAVSAGDQLGLTGNSGNTSEPHIHIHVQDSPDILEFGANGIPLVFESVVVDGERQEDAVPVQGSFVAPE